MSTYCVFVERCQCQDVSADRSKFADRQVVVCLGECRCIVVDVGDSNDNAGPTPHVLEQSRDLVALSEKREGADKQTDGQTGRQTDRHIDTYRHG